MIETLELQFVQRGLLEVALLAIGAGILGTWIVLRGLAFYSHAIGTAAFPGLVLADGLAFAAPLGAVGAAGLFAVLVAALGRGRSDDRGAAVALVLVGMLAAGVILASDVFRSGAGVDSLLFGSLLLISTTDLAVAAAIAVAALSLNALLGARWLASGFDRASTARPLADAILIALIAAAAIATLAAVGALLVAALLVVPAATTRLFVGRMRSWQIATVALAAAIGAAGVLVSVELNAPPGATTAVISGAVFALAAIWRSVGPRLRLGALAIAGAAVLAGCGADDEERVRVVATTTQLADIASEVAGDEVEVVSLLSAGTDVHDYDPRPDDVRAVAEADLVLASGGDVDHWIGRVVRDSGSEAEIVSMLEKMPDAREGFDHDDEHAGEDDGHGHGHADEEEVDDDVDPHWWHSPENVAAAAHEVAEHLAELEPAGTEGFERNAVDFAERVNELERTVAACLEDVPAGDRTMVTDHDAFGYLADHYDLEIVGTVIPSLTTEAQPSARDLAELRETIESRNVSAVFPETSVSSTLAEAIARETGADASHVLYGDSLGPEGSGAETWLGMFEANADAITRGLTDGEIGCSAD